jgi:hypothetical protein
MITQVYAKPHVYSPGYNPIVWSFASDQSSQASFVYVVDVYINGATGSTTPTYRLKQKPNQAGVGMVDVSSIVQPFIDLTLYSAEEGYDLDYKNSADITPSVFLKVGEEYSPATGAPATIFNGFGITGAPAFGVYSLEVDGAPVSVLPGALPYQDGINSMAATGGYGFYEPYLMGGTGASGATGDGLFLKRAGNTQTLGPNDYHTLSFINWNYKYLPGSWGRPILGIRVNWYYGENDPFTGSYYPNITSGGGSNPDIYWDTATWNKDTTIMTFRCGPATLIPPPDIQFYEVWALYRSYQTTNPIVSSGTQASEKVRFYIDQNCQDLYPVVRLSWLNDLGGRDYYNFDMFYELTSTATQEQYSQTPLNWNSFYPVQNDSSSNTSANWQRGGPKIFNKVVGRQFKIQSNWLLQEDIDFLAGVSQSPSVWAYIGDDPIPVTVNVTNLEYTYKNVKQTKLVQASFDCQITKIQQRQNY